MIVNEIFYSLQGEGFLAGVPSVFIRLAGCPLRCKWCDTEYAQQHSAGLDYGIAQITKVIRNWPSRFVVITGGEPMIHPELPQLTRSLKTAGKHITVETAGVVFMADMHCDLMSISPKLSNSGNSSGPDLAVLKDLIGSYNYQMKFVVDFEEDLAEINQVIEKLGRVDLGKAMLMPQARTREELLAKSPMVAELCKRSGFTFCQRLQILLWDNQRGT